jgi:hypothetical protein
MEPPRWPWPSFAWGAPGHARVEPESVDHVLLDGPVSGHMERTKRGKTPVVLLRLGLGHLISSLRTPFRRISRYAES